MSYQRISENIYLLDVCPLGYPRQVSVYLAVGGSEAALFDTGPRIVCDTLLSLLEQVISKIDKLYIALTHIHLDHAGASSLLVRKLIANGIEAKILVHPRGLRHIVNPEKLWTAALQVLGKSAELQGKPEPIGEEYVVALEDNQIIELGDIKVKAIHTPGHAPHHIAYIVYPDNIAVTGDAVAIHYDGRMHPVSPPPFKLDQALQSIDKIKHYNPKKITVTHYGVPPEPGTQALEHGKKKIQEWYQIIKQLVSQGITSPEQILEEILRKDPETKHIVEVRENNPIFKGSALQSIKGILEYMGIKS